MTEKLSSRRRAYASTLTENLRDTLQIQRVEIETGRFTETSESFLFVSAKTHHGRIENFLRERKIEYTHLGNGKFEVFYPQNLMQNEDAKKIIIRLCDRERDQVRITLAEKGYYQKVGGKGKKNKGSFTFNRSATIAEELIMTISIIDKKEDTLRAVASIIKGHYENHPKSALVEVSQKKEGFRVEVRFLPGFFVIKEKNPNPTPPISETSQIEEPFHGSDAEIIREVGIEQALNYNKELRHLVGKLAQTEHEIVIHSWKLFFHAFTNVLCEQNLKVFQQNEKGDLINFSLSELEKLAEISVMSEFELKPRK